VKVLFVALLLLFASCGYVDRQMCRAYKTGFGLGFQVGVEAAAVDSGIVTNVTQHAKGCHAGGSIYGCLPSPPGSRTR